MRALFLSLSIFLPTLAWAEVYPLHIFRSYGDFSSIPALLIGKINTKGIDNSRPPKQVMGYDARLTVVNAAIDNQAHIYPGMKVYIVKRERDHVRDKAALLIAEGEIDSISDTVFSGRVATIRGQFSMVSRQYFIAIPTGSRSNDTKSAEEYLIEAERYRHEGDFARSAQKLQHAREIEPHNPLTALRYAQLALHNGATEKARAALKRGFEDRRRLENVNDYLTLGALYLKIEVESLPSRNRDILKEGTRLLTQMRQFEKDLGQYLKDLTPANSSAFRWRRTRFSALYHLNYGILLRQLGRSLGEYNAEGISRLLGYTERDALYAPIETYVGKTRVLALPRKEWDKAFFNAAITHLQIALLKDRHSEAAFEIIDLCDSLWEGADPNRRRELKEIILEYAPQYLESSHENRRMGRVRSVLNKVNQA